MRIATFNLESLDEAGRGSISLADRIEILRPQLERLDADILCLQEVNGQRRAGVKERQLHALDELLRGTRYAGYNRVTTTTSSGGVADVHNLVTLSRLPIRSHREIRHEFVPQMPYHFLTAQPSAERDSIRSLIFDRSILLAEVEIAGGHTIHVCNVHLRAPLAAAVPGQKEAPFVWRSVSAWAEGYFLSEIKRCGQALELRLLVDQILDRDRGAWIIVCGDFNAQDREPPLDIIVGAEENTGNGLLAWRSLVPLDRGLSAERRYSVLHHGRPQMLDHILVSRPLLAVLGGIEVHNEMLEDEVVVYGKVRDAAGSCHAPLVAIMKLP